MAKKLLAFGWYGGKYSHLSWLLPLLPRSTTFVDVFGGSGAVILNYVKSRSYIYNDIDENLVNFFRVLKCEGAPLIDTLRATPFSREEYHSCLNHRYGADIGKAAQFYTLARQTRTGLGQSATLTRWASCTTSSTGSMSAVTSRWRRGVEKLPLIQERLNNITIECGGYEDVIDRYDANEILFFLDPPYLPSTRSGNLNTYASEMLEEEHINLLRMVNKLKANVAISGYESDLYDRYLSSLGWHKHYGSVKMSSASKIGNRQEVLWTNYDSNGNKIF